MDECRRLLEKQEVQYELARLQALEALRQKFDDERETYLSRIRHLERELEKKSTLEVSSTSPKEPETRKRDDSATPGVGELRESGVKEKASGKVVQRAWTVKVTFQMARATSMLLLLTALVEKGKSLW